MIKRVLITGGAGGIGKYLASAYSKEGYEVFVLDKELCSFQEKNIHTFQVDLCQSDGIKKCFQQIQEQFGCIHILINNGAVSKFHKPVNEIGIDEFSEVIHTNLIGAFVCCKEFVKQHDTSCFGRIINLASTRFHQNEKDWEAYGASKGGLVSLTNSLCVSLSNTNITVNAISPGWIETEDYEHLTLEDHKQHPSGRVGKPQDIVNVCLFLSKEENDFINGANIIVDGGMTKKMIYVEE